MVEYYFVEYRLYNLPPKNIIFDTFSQYQNWCVALEKLNSNNYIAFEVISIKPSRF